MKSPRQTTNPAARPVQDPPRYSGIARTFHWVTAAAVLVMLGTGLVMVYRGDTLDLWDDLTNQLYATHKLLGFTLLWVVLARLAYRLVAGAPPLPADLPVAQKLVARANHAALYVLLLAMPILGWYAISLFPALETFGITLPALTAPDKASYESVIAIHVAGAFVLMGLLALHVAGALHHLLIRRDGVFARMWPGRR